MTGMDDLGPLDFLVFELPAGARAYPGEVVREVTRLSEAEFIRVVQLAMVSRRSDGELTIKDPGEAIGADLPATTKETMDERLLADGLGQAVEGLAPGRVMGVLVYESLWANPLASAVRRSGGEWMGRGRL